MSKKIGKPLDSIGPFPKNVQGEMQSYLARQQATLQLGDALTSSNKRLIGDGKTNISKDETVQISTQEPLDLTLTGTVQISDCGKIALILQDIKYGNEKGFKRIGGGIVTKVIDGRELEMIDEEFFFIGNDGSSITIHVSAHNKAFNSIKIATIDYLGNGILAGLKYKEIGGVKTLELTHGNIAIPELIKLIYQALNSPTLHK